MVAGEIPCLREARKVLSRVLISNLLRVTRVENPTVKHKLGDKKGKGWVEN